MPEVPADLNVFVGPHSHMKQLVKDVEEELLSINFSDSIAWRSMLSQLLSRFREFKSHEDIENQYIVKELVPRLPSCTLATLQNDLHSDNRLNELMMLLGSGLDLETEEESKDSQDLVEFGKKLKTSIHSFNLDFIPHMEEEEQVFLPLLLEHFSEAELRELTTRVLELHHLDPPPNPPPDQASIPASTEKAVDRAAVEVPAHLNVFKTPHYHMKQLVKDIEEELLSINFSDSVARRSVLRQLLSRFREFKSHEDIENQYIVKELVPRLPSRTLATLQNDLHSDNRLNELMTLLDSGLDLGVEEESQYLMEFGEKLKTSIHNFNLDFIPHMEEEEQVFLPLLLEHFSEAELCKLTTRVLELHHLGPAASLPSNHTSKPNPETDDYDQSWLLSLPNELLLQIFSYLSPQDLLNVSRTHPHLQSLSLDGSLWTHVHPVRWATGRWQFFQPPDICNQSLLMEGLVEENDVTKELLSVRGAVNANLTHRSNYCCGEDCEDSAVSQELEVLKCLIDHVLPVAGHHVQTLDLAHGKAVTNEIVFRMLRLCPNLKYLDLSHTSISDFAIKGLLCKGPCSRWRLEYLDLSNCSMITDLTLQRLAQSLLFSPSSPRPSTHHTSTTCQSSFSSITALHHHPPPCSLPGTTCWSQGACGKGGGGGGGGGGGDMECGGCGEGGGVRSTRLKCLILSGCHLITDAGLRCLSSSVGLLQLRYLNLSGLPRITQKGLDLLVASSPELTPNLLFYCDNITTGPYADTTNGCQNLGSYSNVHCCRMLSM